jgi:3-oxoacyl-[acyl-carrier-protein] synthase II
MRLALADAQLSPREIDYINAHGTSTPANDVMETRAIKAVFGDHAHGVPISSNKSQMGHLWGAAGAVESIFTIMTLKTGFLPPTINLEHPDPQCDLDYVPNEGRKTQVRIALKNSFGFGGINGCLVLKRAEQ